MVGAMGAIVVKTSEIVEEALRRCKSLAFGSTCTRAGVGALAGKIVAGELVVLGAASNGSAICTAIEGACGCIHAEARLIVRLLREHPGVRGLAMFTSTAPCPQCAQLIVESRIVSSIAWGMPWRSDLGERIVVASGIARIGT